MMQRKSFTFQVLIMGGFFFFFYMFFSLATSIYRDYKLETEIEVFKGEIEDLAERTNQKPSDLKYLQSEEYKDRYAKENLGLLNPGEKVIILPDPDQVVEQGPVELMTDILSPDSVLNKPNNQQWWEYFFGNTLSVNSGSGNIPNRFFEIEETVPAGSPAEI
ncbi:septum formation initiator family protein [Candidatus Peregrinibacteria bacterium]|nr:septum formation initiator family protein [Candidatus Peregrinibacteria bacterium]